MFAGKFHGIFHIVFQAAILREVVVDDLFGFRAFDAELVAEVGSPGAVDDAEIYGFGRPALLGAYLVDGHAEYARGRGLVDVLLQLEGFEHSLLMADFGDEPQLDLGVVGGKQQMVFVAGNKRFANLPAFGSADRDVLQVGVLAAQAAGGGQSLVERGVHTARARIDERGQGVDVGAFEFHQRAVLQDVGANRVLRGQRAENILVGGVLTAFHFFTRVGQFHPVEQHFAHLFGAGNVEREPRFVQNFLF